MLAGTYFLSYLFRNLNLSILLPVNVSEISRLVTNSVDRAATSDLSLQFYIRPLCANTKVIYGN